MEFKRCEKGEKVHIPSCYISKSDDGWTIDIAPNDGLIVVTTTKEKALGGMFITDEQLEGLGYVHCNSKPLCAEGEKGKEVAEK